MHTLVTGGTGFIGSHLVDRLLQHGDTPIVVLDNLHRGSWGKLAAHQNNSRLRLVNGDIRDAGLVRDLSSGADTIFHLAAQSNVMGAVSDISYSFETNVAGTLNVLEAARAAGVRRVLFSSSREVYGEVEHLPVAEDQPLAAKNAYGASKAAGELYCRVFGATYGLEVAVLRLANVYGPRDSGRVIPLWLDAVAAGQNLTVYGGQQVIDFVWVEQVVEALVRAAAAPVAGRAINIGSGQGTPILALAERIIALAGATVALDRQPARSVEVPRFVADVTLMQTLLGIEPPVDPLFALERLWREQNNREGPGEGSALPSIPPQ
jgi:UDP-glucose 4-epimerase